MLTIRNRSAARTRIGFAVLALLSLAACRSTGGPPPPIPITPEQGLDWQAFPLGANDMIRVSVYNHPELSTPEEGTRIDNEGFLSLPLLGLIPIGGTHVPEARERITEAYTEYVKDPRVDVSIASYGARRFYLFGELENPGPYPFDRALNAYQALTYGGSFKPTAQRDAVWLLRREEGFVRARVINASDLDASGLVALRPDDFLYVPRSGAGNFSEEVLPYLQGIGWTLSSVATAFLIEDSVSD